MDRPGPTSWLDSLSSEVCADSALSPTPAADDQFDFNQLDEIALQQSLQFDPGFFSFEAADDAVGPAYAEPAPTTHNLNGVEFCDWFNEDWEHDFVSSRKAFVQNDVAVPLSDDKRSEWLQRSETLQNETLSKRDGGGRLSPGTPTNIQRQNSEAHWSDSTPSSSSSIQATKPHLPVELRQELSTSSSLGSSRTARTLSPKSTDTPLAQAKQAILNDHEDNEHLGPGYEWKKVARRALLPGCAVYAPNERKRHRDTIPQEEATSRRASKSRKKSGDVCARCKLYRERCSGTFPCERCSTLPGWLHLCVRATFANETAFNNGLYKARTLILLHNVKRWHPDTTHPPVDLKVGIGFPPALPIQVNAFDAIDAKLLEHVNFRNLTSAFLRTTRTQPFGVYGFVVKNQALDKFFDRLVPFLIEDQFKAGPDGFSRKVFKTVYDFSREPERPEAIMLERILRVWATQNIFFGRIWRLSEGGESVGAILHPEIGAYDAPRFLYWQLDCIAERYAYEQEVAVLKDLESYMFARKKSPWLSVILTSYIYLTVLERNTWNLESWKTKSQRWASDPRAAKNPTMVWPLSEKPDVLIEKNEAKVRLVSSHVRNISRGNAPFFKDSFGEVKANVKSAKGDTEIFTSALADDFDALCQHLLLSRSCMYSEDDWTSLDYKFSRMMIDTGD